MISNYELTIWLLCAFFSLIGMIFLYMSRQFGPAEDKAFVKVRLFLFLFAILYFSLAHYSAYTAIVYSVEYGNDAPCENLINTSIVDAGTNTTTFTYMNSCTSTVPDAHNAFQVGYGYLIWILAVILMVGSLYIIVAAGVRKW